MNKQIENTLKIEQIGSLLREEEVAKILSVSRACLRKWRQPNRGPEFVRLAGGSAVRYPLVGLLTWIQNQPGGGTVEEQRDDGRAA